MPLKLPRRTLLALDRLGMQSWSKLGELDRTFILNKHDVLVYQSVDYLDFVEFINMLDTLVSLGCEIQLAQKPAVVHIVAFKDFFGFSAQVDWTPQLWGKDHFCLLQQTIDLYDTTYHHAYTDEREELYNA